MSPPKVHPIFFLNMHVWWWIFSV